MLSSHALFYYLGRVGDDKRNNNCLTCVDVSLFYFYIGTQENKNDLSTILCPDTFFNDIMVLTKFPYSSKFGAR